MAQFGSQYYGGTRRFFFSRASEADSPWAASAAALDGVLNYMDGSDMVGPPNKMLFNNANTAQGQSEWATKQFEGPEDHQGSPTFPLTAEAFAKFHSSAAGSDTHTVVDTTADQHVIALTETPSPFTIEEHVRGAAQTTQSYKFTGCWVNSWTINVSNGPGYATISPSIVASKYIGAGDDQTSLDIVDYWPVNPGVPHTKCGCWIAPTTGSNLTSAFDGAFHPITSLEAVMAEDLLAGEIDMAQRADSWSLTFDTGVDLSALYRAGSTSTAGFIRGLPYAKQRLFTATFNFAVDPTSDNLLDYFANFTDANQNGWTLQFSFIEENLCGSTYYQAAHLVCNAMRITGKTAIDGGLGPMMASVSFEGLQAASADAYLECTVWDTINDVYTDP